jgi:hypothetical protein
VVKVLKPARTSWLTRTVKNSPTVGTSNSYVASTLRKGFPSYLCKLHTQHPSWSYRCKFFQINKVKGQLGFPQKTKSPSGATAVGIPPPKKMAQFFCKTRRKHTKYTSTQVLGEPTRDAGG